MVFQGRAGNGSGCIRKRFRRDADIMLRASSSFAPTARSSVSRTARPNRSSFSARTRAASPGPSYAGDRGGRASLRYAIATRQSHPKLCWISMLMYPTGASQDPPPPSGQVPACGRRRLPRCDQGASHPASGSPQRRSRASDQGGQGEAYCCAER